jgi:hypothetical protein
MFLAALDNVTTAVIGALDYLCLVPVLCLFSMVKLVHFFWCALLPASSPFCLKHLPFFNLFVTIIGTSLFQGQWVYCEALHGIRCRIINE